MQMAALAHHFMRPPLDGLSELTVFAQFIRICRWLQLIHKDRRAPLENAPFSTLWARKRYRVAQCFRQYLRATNCYKLSDYFMGKELYLN
jgi:hypothetical protein